MIIKINDIKANLKLGINKWEQEKSRRVTISFEFKIKDLDSYTLDDTTNYDQFTKDLITYLEIGSFDLIENLAIYIKNYTLERLSDIIDSGKIEIKKDFALLGNGYPVIVLKF